ncbi:MAG: permease [Omnitrophica bacterium RIFCSPLOWO2_01_FULL_45_10]|nr:MAG: permease [Omnitrophica bacterium RIFCSPLOWO2_01_FULL_45_10]
MLNLSYLLLGACAGIFGGFLGVGGGIIIIPVLVLIYGLTQHEAQGTSLAAMVPPITLLAAMRYYQSGNVKVAEAIFIAMGFVLGGLIGAHIVQYLPDAALKKVFGVALLGLAVKMLLS